MRCGRGQARRGRGEARQAEEGGRKAGRGQCGGFCTISSVVVAVVVVSRVSARTILTALTAGRVFRPSWLRAPSARPRPLTSAPCPAAQRGTPHLHKRVSARIARMHGLHGYSESKRGGVRWKKRGGGERGGVREEHRHIRCIRGLYMGGCHGRVFACWAMLGGCIRIPARVLYDTERERKGEI